jgi:hypothetical protein
MREVIHLVPCPMIVASADAGAVQVKVPVAPSITPIDVIDIGPRIPAIAQLHCLLLFGDLPSHRMFNAVDQKMNAILVVLQSYLVAVNRSLPNSDVAKLIDADSKL